MSTGKDKSIGVNSVVEKMEELLHDDKNFTTRTGLKFTASVLREALRVVSDVVTQNDQIGQRLAEIDKAFLQFMKQQNDKEQRAEEARNKWRWALITPTLGVLIVEIIKGIMEYVRSKP